MEGVEQDERSELPPPAAEGSHAGWLGTTPEEALRALREHTAPGDQVYLVPWRPWTPQLEERVVSRVEEAAAARRQRLYQRLRESWHPSPLWPTEAAFEHWVEEQEDKVAADGWCYSPPGLDLYPGPNVPRSLGSQPGDSGSDGEGEVRYYVGMLTPMRPEKASQTQSYDAQPSQQREGPVRMSGPLAVVQAAASGGSNHAHSRDQVQR